MAGILHTIGCTTLLSKHRKEEKEKVYFNGLARTLWPMVTKLVSWFDMNQAKEETLQHRCKNTLEQWQGMIFDGNRASEN